MTFRTSLVCKLYGKINCRQFHIAKSLTEIFWSNASQNFSYLLDKIAIALSSSPAIYKMKLP